MRKRSVSHLGRCTALSSRTESERYWEARTKMIERNVRKCNFNRYSVEKQFGNSPLESSCVVVVLIEKYVYSTSKPLNVDPEKSLVLSCDTVVANERFDQHDSYCQFDQHDSYCRFDQHDFYCRFDQHDSYCRFDQHDSYCGFVNTILNVGLINTILNVGLINRISLSV